MQYQLYFDSAQKSLEWPQVIPAVVLVLLAAVSIVAWVRGISLVPDEPPATGPSYYWFFPVLAGLWIVALDLNGYAAYRNDDSAVVEGVVRDYQTSHTTSYGNEQFRVNDVFFSYSDRSISHTFNQTNYRKVPIREGLPVRVTYSGTPQNAQILRLEIGKPAG